MKASLKYIGLIIQLVGVAILLIPKFMGTISNQTLLIGGVCIVLGLGIYIVVNNPWIILKHVQKIVRFFTKKKTSAPLQNK